MRRSARTTVSAAMAATLVAGLTLTATPSYAGPALMDCPSGSVCLYKGSPANDDLIGSSSATMHWWRLSGGTYYVVNNGNQQAGYDHYAFQLTNGDWWCRPYNRSRGCLRRVRSGMLVVPRSEREGRDVAPSPVSDRPV